jgi:hypothetical protein
MMPLQRLGIGIFPPHAPWWRMSIIDVWWSRTRWTRARDWLVWSDIATLEPRRVGVLYLGRLAIALCW